MKPTTEQQRALKKYLGNNLRYSETQAEIYDHILTAMEVKYTDMPYQDAVDRIIAEDFKGFEGMAEIEARYHRETMREMKRRYLDYLTAYLKFPSVIILLIISLPLYYLIKLHGFNFMLLFLVYGIMSLIPSLLNIRYIKLGHFFKNINRSVKVFLVLLFSIPIYYLIKRPEPVFALLFLSFIIMSLLLNNIQYTKPGYFFSNIYRSVKDDGFTWMKYFPRISIIIIGVMHYLVTKVNTVVWVENEPMLITMFFIFYGLNLMAYYKVFRDEFKVSLTQ